MDDSTLIDRLVALQPPAIEAGRRRAIEAVSSRVSIAATASGREDGVSGEGLVAASMETPSNRLRPWYRKHLLLIGLGTACLAALVVLIVSLGGGGTEQPAPAYGAELVRFAESTPLLLLEEPGWRVQDLYEEETREGTDGSIEFVTGKSIPFESIRSTGNIKTGQHETGMAPAALRQRKVELTWSHRGLAEAVAVAHHSYHAHRQRWARVPVLGTTADVDTRAEIFVNQGGPGDRQMTAYWSEGGYLLELRAAVPDLAALEERLGWLAVVDSQTWLDALPAKVIKAADHRATVRAMLKGIPRPSGFKPSLVPLAGLTTNRGQVAAAVTNTVSCLWFRQWGAARATGDKAAKAEAEKAMATYRQWPILREEAKESGGYPETLAKLVASMPSGVWQFGPNRYRLLPKAEGLGCARSGIPVLPWKQKRQRQRGGSPLPR